MPNKCSDIRKNTRCYRHITINRYDDRRDHKENKSGIQTRDERRSLIEHERKRPDAEVAEKLWHEEIRESKLLAPMLYPAEMMDMETAKRWITEIPNTEVADICNMYLISKLPYAKTLAYEYSKSDKELEIYIALSLFNRLAMAGGIGEKEKTDIMAIAEQHKAETSPTVTIAALRLADRLQ